MRSDRAVAAWLLLCAALTFAIVVVGGITRLTESGLSIVEWRPVTGALPPLTEADWQGEFDKYKTSPQFQKTFSEIGLDGFKRIFWWEYTHRLLARTIGVVFLLPFLYFLFTRKIQGALIWKLGGIFVLGGLQGALGWYMVKSGLVDDPRVSHLRLTAHLGLALLIFSFELWIALQLLKSNSRKNPLALIVVAVVFLMALSGGFVAGLRAGHAYNTFPLMNGHIVPPEAFQLEPWWDNFLWNVATVQLVHRTIFWLLLLLIPTLWWNHRKQLPANALLAAFGLQALLGISTLLLAVPVHLAACHQAGAVLLLACALWTAQRSGT